MVTKSRPLIGSFGGLGGEPNGEHLSFGRLPGDMAAAATNEKGACLSLPKEIISGTIAAVLLVSCSTTDDPTDTTSPGIDDELVDDLTTTTEAETTTTAAN